MGLLLRQGWYTVNVYRSDPINSIGKSFGILYIGNLSTIPVEPGFLWDFVFLSLKTCSLYHEKLFIQKFKVISRKCGKSGKFEEKRLQKREKHFKSFR
jgi:hypothetical protein